MFEPGPARAHARGRRGRRRGRALAWALRLIVLVVVFVAGLAVGRALEQGPQPGGTLTVVRTLEPQTVTPAERTVTVTTAG